MFTILLSLAGCFLIPPCPTEGFIDVVGVDGAGQVIIPDETHAVDSEGNLFEGVCSSAGCRILTEIEGKHTVTATWQGEEVTGTASPFVMERCMGATDEVTLEFEGIEGEKSDGPCVALKCAGAVI